MFNIEKDNLRIAASKKELEKYSQEEYEKRDSEDAESQKRDSAILDKKKVAAELTEMEV